MKNIKNMFLAFALTVCLAGVSNAASRWYTFTSTGVFVTSSTALTNAGAPLSLDWVRISTGNGVSPVILIDTAPKAAALAAVESNLKRQAITEYPSKQWFCPPLVMSSTASFAMPYFTDFRDKDGVGLPVTNGIVVLQPTANDGEWQTVTVGYSVRRK